MGGTFATQMLVLIAGAAATLTQVGLDLSEVVVATGGTVAVARFSISTVSPFRIVSLSQRSRSSPIATASSTFQVFLFLGEFVIVAGAHPGPRVAP